MHVILLQLSISFMHGLLKRSGLIVVFLANSMCNKKKKLVQIEWIYVCVCVSLATAWVCVAGARRNEYIILFLHYYYYYYFSFFFLLFHLFLHFNSIIKSENAFYKMTPTVWRLNGCVISFFFCCFFVFLLIFLGNNLDANDYNSSNNNIEQKCK